MEFRCRLASPSGEITEGIYVADTEARLRHELEEKGLYVLSLQPKGAIGGLSLALPQRRAINTREFLVFNQELATLLKAGMPLVQSLDILRQRVLNPTFKAVLDEIYDRVKAGAALSDAVAAHPDLFPPVYAASLMAGERAGNLDEVIRRYVAYEKVIGAVRRRTISALIYPAILATLMLILIGIIVLRVVPAFSEFYSNFGRALPLSTRIVVGFSGFVVSNFAILAAACAAIGIGLVIERLHRPDGARPVVAHVVRRIADESEGLIACHRAIGIDRRQVDLVLPRRKIADRVARVVERQQEAVAKADAVAAQRQRVRRSGRGPRP